MELIDLPGVGEKTLHLLNLHGITTIPQLLIYYPRTYRTYYAKTAKTVLQGEWVSLQGQLSRPVSHHTGRVSTQLSTFRDETGTLTIRWFNSPFVTRSVSPATTYLVRGQLDSFSGRLQIVNPQLTKLRLENPSLPIDEIQPIYTPLGTLKSGHLRNLIKSALDHLSPDPLPLAIQNRYSLLDFATTIRSIHFPSSKSDLENAIHRLAFDELFALQKEALKNRELAQVPTLPLSLNQPELADFIASLPFTPTAAQSRVIQEITADLSQPLAMHRLLSGEVGSGKTLVAAYSALLTHYSSRRTLLMAPTQILAEQLFANFSSLLGSRCTFSLLTSVSKGDVDADIVIGTHALLKQIANFHNIGLVIIDEQHRFGVDQRLLLTKLNPAPHFLMMTATPIPRTLAMTVFSHLSLSRLDELPQNRLPVKTYHVTEDKRVAAYDWIRQEVLTHQNQAFVVVPLIDQAEDDETSATQSLKKLEKDLSARFPDLVVDIMHGRMKGSEKTAHLQAFRDGHTQILVATSMIEVGLDIPEANIMVIENADRFGLATLHQLRGRVGRGGKQGHCLLFAHQPSEKALARLAYFVREKDGAKLAEFDLASRGPGELYGTTQHGFFSLRFASIYDQALLRQTAEAVKMLSI